MKDEERCVHPIFEYIALFLPMRTYLNPVGAHGIDDEPG